MRAPADISQEFRSRGLKLTPQRQLLFRLLHGNLSHPTAESLFEAASEQMPGISLRTVYQTLHDLTEMGELRPVQMAGGAVRFDPNVADHHHAQCDRCGRLIDVEVRKLEQLELHGVEGFRRDRTSIVFSGRCAGCAD